MFYDNLSDQELISHYIEGNQKSLEVLINRHKKKVFNYILMTIKDKHLAEDIFQDTFIKVINTLHSSNYKEEGKFLQWVMRIAHNLIIDYFRKSKKIPVIENSLEHNIFETLNVLDNNVEDKIIYEQIQADIRSLIDYLPPEQKEVLIMRHYADMSFKEIAEQTNVSINTALGRMRYALINLRKLIASKEIILTH
ncbi:MAG TPA: sigma-70 family RNA polymerase sigma factor [Bacteroidales bacterium]|nr:sigma-70 family RNA polymerase sigma factor [Bacteroidales bacterium]